MPIIDNRPSAGGGGGGGGGTITSVNGQTGPAVVLTKSNIGLSNVDNTSDANKPVSTAQQTALDLKADASALTTHVSDTANPHAVTKAQVGLSDVDNTSDADKPISSATQTALNQKVDQTVFDNAVSDLEALTTGTADALARFDSTGQLESAGSYLFNAEDGINEDHTVQPDDENGNNFHNVILRFDPLQDSPDETWNYLNNTFDFDPNSSGFGFGDNGQAFNYDNVYMRHIGTGDLGTLNFRKSSFDIGNGTDPITFKGVAYDLGFGTIHDNVLLDGPMQGYGFQFNIEAGVTLGNTYSNGFYDTCNIDCVWNASWNSFVSSPSHEAIGNNFNMVGYSFNPTIDELQGNANCFGVAINGNIGADGIGTGGVYGLSVNQNVDNAENYQGVYVNTQNVVPKAGSTSSLTFQDLYFEFNAPANNNNYSILYIDDQTAGSETVALNGNVIEVHMEDGVSTADQIQDAIEATAGLNTAVSITLVGVGSNPQTAGASGNFTGGSNPGNVKAGYFDGDVEITGNLTFGGALSIGRLNAFGTYTPVDGGGNPGSIHSLISQVAVPDGSTINNVDTFGINTAMLVEVGDNCTLSSGFLKIGMTALGLPAVFKMGANSYLDALGGAIFALNIDATTDPTAVVDQAYGGRFLPIPGGNGVFNRFYGMWAQSPAGVLATKNWGVYQEDAEWNYFEGATKIGGTDEPDAGKQLHVDGDVLIEGDLEVTGSIIGVSTVTHKYTLLAGDVTAKQITLPSTPATASEVRLTVIGGIEQDYGVDFTVTGDVLSWDTLGYEAFAETDDKFIVTYRI